nr:unnamed protein product [Callosobruchus analis]
MEYSTVFENSEFYKKLQRKNLSIPAPAKVTNTGPALPTVFLADEVFDLQENIMHPYSGRQLAEKKGIFNYRLLRDWTYIECTYGILSNK